MSKEAYYFSHDGNARNDDKIIAVRMRHSAEGYGIYFMILERLMESSNYMSVKDYNIIAFDLRVSADKVKSIVEDFGLFSFSDDGKYFYSESFNRRMKPLENTREQRRQAGVNSARKRAEKKQNSTTVERPLTENSTTVDENSNKVKESKVNIINNNYKPIEKFLISDLVFDFSNRQSWIESICMKHHLTVLDVKDYLKQFETHLQSILKKEETEIDFASHFTNWLPKKLKEKSSAKKEKLSKLEHNTKILGSVLAKIEGGEI